MLHAETPRTLFFEDLCNLEDCSLQGIRELLKGWMAQPGVGWGQSTPRPGVFLQFPFPRRVRVPFLPDVFPAEEPTEPANSGSPEDRCLTIESDIEWISVDIFQLPEDGKEGAVLGELVDQEGTIRLDEIPEERRAAALRDAFLYEVKWLRLRCREVWRGLDPKNGPDIKQLTDLGDLKNPRCYAPNANLPFIDMDAGDPFSLKWRGDLPMRESLRSIVVRSLVQACEDEERRKTLRAAVVCRRCGRCARRARPRENLRNCSEECRDLGRPGDPDKSVDAETIVGLATWVGGGLA